MRVTRRKFIGTAAASAALSCSKQEQPPADKPAAEAPPERAPAAGTPAPIGKGRVVMLGFDGVEPGIAEAMLDAGDLPHLAQLRDQGGYQRLGSSNPPQSPTAWSSFATCTWPGDHGIFDFLRRNPSNYFPGLGFGMTTKPKLANGAVSKPPEFVNYRTGENFWMAAKDRGLVSKLLFVPYAYPVEDLGPGCMIAGLEMPDIRGTQSTSFALSEDIAQEESVGGGVRLPLKLVGDTAEVLVPGYRHPETREYLRVPMTITVDRANKRVRVAVQGQEAEVEEKGWSTWLRWTYEVTPQFRVYGISQVHVVQADAPVRLYMTCLMYDPDHPYVPMSHPAGYSADLAQRFGVFKTVGWAYDTKGLERGDFSEDAFLEDVRQTMAWRERVLMDELDRGQTHLLISGWIATDRVAHMFWRFRDPKHPLYTPEGAEKYGRAIEQTYQAMDRIVGKVAEKLGPDDLLMVLSDHGFHSFRTTFSLNTWLVRNGYLAVKEQQEPATAATDTKYLQGFDWARSKCYGLGLGGAYLNLQGREANGAVAPGEAEALIAEIRGKLLEERDPETGAKIFSNVHTRAEYAGLSQADAPDLQMGYADGYQTDKTSAAGAAPEAVYAPNDKKWSADHAASDVAITPGILFANRALPDGPRIIDLGPTALAHLGVEVPSNLKGDALV